MTQPPPAAPTRPQRSAALIFTQSVLALQSLAVLFSTLVVYGLDRAGQLSVPQGWIWGGGLVLVVLFAYAASAQKKRWGRWLGWALQAPMLVAAALEVMIAVIGVVFLMLWITGIVLGERIDRERAERMAAERAGAS